MNAKGLFNGEGGATKQEGGLFSFIFFLFSPTGALLPMLSWLSISTPFLFSSLLFYFTFFPLCLAIFTFTLDCPFSGSPPIQTKLIRCGHHSDLCLF